MNNRFDIKTVEKLFADAIPVKVTCCREVRCSSDIFIKLDRRRMHSFSREMTAAKKLRAAGIPVVDHLFCGRGKFGHYLVTGRFGIPVDEYLRSGTPDIKFFCKITDLALQMLKAGFLHGDFHPGNLLYDPASGSLMLTDVRRVMKLPEWILRRLPEKSKFHILTEFRGFLKKKELLVLFRRAKITNPLKFYENMFEWDNVLIRKEWKRRRKQILSGYRKFTRKEGSILFNSSATDQELAEAEIIPGGKAVFLAGYFLDLINMPHRKVLRYDIDTDTVYALPESPGRPGGELTLEMIYRLNSYDITNSAPEDWSVCENGLPCFNALNKVAEESFILEK